jgi:pyruvyltransferase
MEADLARLASLGASGRTAAFWCRSPSRGNVGDALGPWLVRRLSGRLPVYLAPEDPRPKHFLVGSIIEQAGAGAIVWGSGLLRARGTVSPRATLLAVRGPRTRARALECGAVCPPILGDPALLLSRLFSPPPRTRAGIGIVPHYSDLPRHLGQWSLGGAMRLISVLSSVEQFACDVSACELIVSSSLHGIIVAHAYGIPAVWVKFRPLVPPDDTKFFDYFESVGIQDARSLHSDGRLDPAELEACAITPGTIDLEPLWRACPFRMIQ